MTSDEDIISWVEDHYDPEEMTPEEFIETTTFSDIRRDIALGAAEDIYDAFIRAREEEEEEIRPPGIIQRLISGVVSFIRRFFRL